LIAVPVAAVIKVLARHLLGFYLESPFYRGRSGEALRDEAASSSGLERDRAPAPVKGQYE
jgi:hypothetical protein